MSPLLPSHTRPWRRAARGAAWGLGVLIALHATALLLLSRASVEAALRARIEAALRARIGAVELGPEVRVDPLLRVTFGPVTIPGVRPTDPPLVRVDRVKVRPDLWTLVRAGRGVPASIRLYDVAVDLPPQPGALERAWERLRPPRRAAAAARAGAEAPEPEEGAAAPVHLRDLRVTATLGGRRATFGPIRLSVLRSRAAGGEELALAAELPGAGRAHATVRRGPAGWRGAGELEGVGPELLPDPLRDLPVAWSQGEISARLEGEAASDLTRAEATLQVAVSGAFVRGEVLAPEPVGPLAAALSGQLRWDGIERRVSFSGGRLELLGTVPIALDGELRIGPGLPFSGVAHAERVDYAAAAASLPRPLALPEEAPHPTGALDARVAASGPLLAPGAWQVEAALDLSRMREAARRAPPVALRAPFVYHPAVEEGTAPDVAIGPESPRFVPIADLPAHVIRAVTASEDAGFFAHSGFDFDELRNAAVQGAEAGRVVRGGSTITQQLAKNLFLSREKTLARKLREAFLTVALEATVPKQRLLEIYLNIVEWGPGLWGIGPAAQHWFGKDARALTPREAAFLATVIPGPVRYHYLWNRGAPTEAWDARVNGLLVKMGAQGVLTGEELQDALAQPLAFPRPEASTAPAAASAEPADDPLELQPRAGHRQRRSAR
jgi:hypothetical protein